MRLSHAFSVWADCFSGDMRSVRDFSATLPALVQLIRVTTFENIFSELECHLTV